jgi:hypothetical protein
MASTGSDEKDISPGLEVAPHQLDLKINREDESLELTTQELRRLKRIVDWRILPYISLLYLFSAFRDAAQRVLSHSHALVDCVDPRFLGPREFYPGLYEIQLNSNAR